MVKLYKRTRRCPECGFPNKTDGVKCEGCTHKFSGARPYHVKWKDYSDGGTWKQVRGDTDKTRSLEIGQMLEFRSRQEKYGHVNPLENGPTLDEHLSAYLVHLSQGSKSKHPEQSLSRIKKFSFQSVGEIVGGTASEKVNRSLAENLKNESTDTRNHYRTAIKGFCRWLTRERGLPSSPICYLKKEKVTDQQIRRALTPEEVKRLLTTLVETRSTLSPEQRFYLYVTALNTGFRCEELSRLTPSRFSLGQNPTVKLLAAETKSKKEILQPFNTLNSDLGKMFKTWFKGKAADEILWPSKWWGRTAEMLKADLDHAKIKITTADGVADFHSLRSTYITSLVLAGYFPNTVQKLARHSTMELTMRHYAKLTPKNISDEIKKHCPAVPNTYQNWCPAVSNGVPRVPSLTTKKMNVKREKITS